MISSAWKYLCTVHAHGTLGSVLKTKENNLGAAMWNH